MQNFNNQLDNKYINISRPVMPLLVLYLEKVQILFDSEEPCQIFSGYVQKTICISCQNCLRCILLYQMLHSWVVSLAQDGYPQYA